MHNFVRDSYEFESYVVIYTGMRNRKIVYSLWDNCADAKTTVDGTQTVDETQTENQVISYLLIILLLISTLENNYLHKFIISHFSNTTFFVELITSTSISMQVIKIGLYCTKWPFSVIANTIDLQNLIEEYLGIRSWAKRRRRRR